MIELPASIKTRPLSTTSPELVHVMLSQISEKQAIELLKIGDPKGFEFLYRLHKRRVFSLCLRLAGNHAIAEELTQEAFLLVFRRIATFRGDSAFSTWLHRLTVNVVFMYIRQQHSRIVPQASLEQTDFEENEHLRDRIGAPDPVLSRSIDRITLEDAIRRLAPGYRIILVLHDIEGYEHQEIADLLSCSVGNTKSQLHKARLKLRTLLSERAQREARPARRHEPSRIHLATEAA
jgi:RNA polymerase sigma-70 factor, ECF subfamily